MAPPASSPPFEYAYDDLPPPNPRAWATSAALVGIGAGFIGVVFMIAAVAVWQVAAGPPPMALMIAASMLGMQVPAAAAVLLVSRLRIPAADWAEATSLQVPTLRDIAAGILWGVLALAMGLVVGNIIDLIYTMRDMELQSQDAVQLMMDGDLATMITLIVGATILAPICEEIVFRLAIFEALRRWLPAGLSVVITSLMFGVVHFTLALLVPLVLLGAILQVSRMCHKSLVVPIIAHMIFNSATVIAIIAQRYVGGTLGG